MRGSDGSLTINPKGITILIWNIDPVAIATIATATFMLINCLLILPWA